MERLVMVMVVKLVVYRTEERDGVKIIQGCQRTMRSLVASGKQNNTMSESNLNHFSYGHSPDDRGELTVRCDGFGFELMVQK